MDVSMRALDAAGELVLDLTVANGYRVRALSSSGQTWRRTTDTSPWVDGDVEVGPATLASETKEFVVKIEGASWPQVCYRLQALVDAVAGASLWHLEVGVEGVIETSRAQRADWSSPQRISDVKNCTRSVNLSIPTQPGAAITGLEA